MINDELIRKAARAAQHGYSTPFDDLDDREREKLLAQTRAALETVASFAASIWDEGEKAGYIHGQHDTHRFDPGPDYTETPNPYRNEHA